MRFPPGCMLLGVAVLLSTAGLSGEQPQRPSARHKWACVQQIPAHQNIRVHLRNGGLLQGTFVEADSGELTLLAGRNRSRRVGRQEVQRIGTGARATRALWGGLVGLGLGAAMGAGIGCPDCKSPTSNDRAAGAAIFGGVFGAIGAGIGAAVGGERKLCDLSEETSAPQR